MKAILEIVIHLESFRNVDLLHQGLYQLEFAAHIDTAEGKLKAHPLTTESVSQKRERFLKFNPHKIREGDLLQESNTARSRVFMIRYNDEQIKIDDICSFLLEIPMSAASSPLCISVDLFYMKLRSDHCIAKDYEPFKQINLSKVTSNVFAVSNPMSGVHSFLPINFGKSWRSTADAILHTVFFNYVNPTPSHFLETAFNNIEEVLDPAIINQKYNEYVSQLGQTYESIRSNIDNLTCVDLSKDFPVPPLLKLPLNADHSTNLLLTFTDTLESLTSSEVTAQILSEIKKISNSIQASFQTLRQMATEYPRSAAKFYCNKYCDTVLERYGHFVVVETTLDFESPLSNVSSAHAKKSKTMRNSPFHLNLPQLPVHKADFFPETEVHPIIFQEVYGHRHVFAECVRHPVIRSMQDIHVVVLVHGFQGFASDMRMLKNNLSMVFPKTFFIESSFNEFRTDDNIDEMGFRLAKEVITFLSEVSSGEVPHISFIGHSLGGLVARAALPYLECLSDRMHTYMSLATPHLGMLEPKSFIDAGMWVLRKMRKSLSLKQLCFDDFGFKEGTFLYRLSQSPGLEWFKHIVLVSSAQDCYVQPESARIEVPPKLDKNSEKGELYAKLIYNIMSRLNLHNVVKFDVNFKLKTSIDSMIGRSAHLQLIESEDFIKMMIYRYPEFFA